MKKLTLMALACMLVTSLSVVLAQAQEAAAQVDLNVGASVKINAASTSVSVKGNATSSAASDKSGRTNTNSTSSGSAAVRGNATSSAAQTKNATSTGSRGAEHRSEVATFVQTLLNSADRLWGIGEQVRVIARDQASSSEKIATSVEKLEDRGSFKTFLIGSDYKNIGEIRSQLAQSAGRLAQLERELQKVGSTTEAATVAAEIDAVTKNQLEIEAYLKTQESRFSLFGWFARLVQ